MKRVAKFYKVSFEQFLKDWCDTFNLNEENTDTVKEVRKIWDLLKLPKRATKDSAGYDFFTPIKIELTPNETIKIPTGIKCKIADGWVLKLYPRSGLGFKYRLQLNNSVGIIDGDYIFSDNEGHIFAKITNGTNENKTVEVNAGDGFIQGIFVQYGLTVDDDSDGVRNGGFGSTTKS